jgi:gliding motility-associated protein GldM
MAGGGKETPRQKMIGMMYLVLTALLALNVSKDILKGFITVNESMERTNASLIDNQVKSLQDFREYAKGDSIARIHLAITEDIFKLTQEGYEYVNKLKAHVIANTENLDNPAAADTMHLRFTEKQDDYDTPTYLLIGDDESSPKSGALTARELKDKIINIHNQMLTKLDALQKDESAKLLEPDYNRLAGKIKSLYPIEPTVPVEGVLESWETQNFNHLPLAAVITNLTKIQNDIKSIETSFLGELSTASTKSHTKIDKLGAQVFSETGYVQQGMPFKADIFLSASSSDFTNENLQVLLGGEYDFSKKTAIKEGNPINTVGGIGKYEITTSAQGEQVIKGAIKLKNPHNVFEYYPYEYKYMVAAPSAAVSPDKMNVLYVGLDNPVSISAAGIAPSNLIVTSSGGGATLTAKGNGKYMVNVTQKGECLISVSARMPDGTVRQQGPPMRFRVKSVPNPVPRINGNDVTGSLELKKLQLMGIGSVAASLPNFEFENVNFTVTSYNFVYIKNGVIEEIPVTGSNLPPKAKEILASAKPGARIFFEKIQATGPGGKRTLNDVMIKVKS